MQLQVELGIESAHRELNGQPQGLHSQTGTMLGDEIEPHESGQARVAMGVGLQVQDGVFNGPVDIVFVGIFGSLRTAIVVVLLAGVNLVNQ